ncbi:homeobox protein Mohawk-like [Osmerus mordax]|uniref:homeobox protein Mohawk-like n=1 Tax=Osmerus mordax TaxID=8014 RepID=UPI00350EA81F
MDVQHQEKRMDVQHQERRMDVQHQEKRMDVQHQERRMDVQHQERRMDVQHQERAQLGGAGEEGEPGAGQRRQVLQSMARPLKLWLYQHRDNPYPTKTEKLLLALASHMTLVQVSNWFANARRRLKNTVRQPDLSWALRIQLYEQLTQGSAERLSAERLSAERLSAERLSAERLSQNSADTHSDDGFLSATPTSQSELNRPIRVTNQESSTRGAGLRIGSAHRVSPPSKYKSSLLHRYLNDSLQHALAHADDVTGSHCRGRSQSISSIEADEELVSPSSSSEAENSVIHHVGALLRAVLYRGGVDLGRCGPGVVWTWGGEDLGWTWGGVDLGRCGPGVVWTWGGVDLGRSGPVEVWTWGGLDLGRSGPGEVWTWGGVDLGRCGPVEVWSGGEGREDEDWREIHAAMALTNLAQGQSCTTGPIPGRSCTTGPIPGRSCTTGPIPGRSCTTGPIPGRRQSCTTGPIITSCIIQKSSHISEVKTVKLAVLSHR